jgi:PhnB protein
MNPSHVPAGYHSVNPYLIVDDAARAMEFYRKAFDAAEVMRMAGPNGKLMHAEVQIGDSRVMFADEVPQIGALSPKSVGGSSVFIALYVGDVDRVVQTAVAAGAQILRPVQDQFYGDRSGTILDPFGHKWTIATRKEELSPEEIERRFAAMMKGGGH